MYTHGISHDGKTPLLCAAEAGHDEIVAYLLEFEEVQAALKKQEEVVNASVSKSVVRSYDENFVTMQNLKLGGIYCQC